MPPRDEVRGWSRLVAGVADQVVAATAQNLHRAISDGVFRWMGPVGRPVRSVHDRFVDRAYGTVRASLRLAGELGALAADVVVADTTVPSPAAVKARAIAQGVVSDELIALAPELDLELTLRHAGHDVPLESAALRSAYPAATGRVAVFVHGLVDSETVWSALPASGPSLPTVATAQDFTPVLVRYGTGRAVGRNGSALAELLESLLATWPVPITRLVIVGHSMGGLLARSACLHAEQRAHAWLTPLTDVVYLGTPHLGSWLEKVANVGSWMLRRTSRGAPIGTLLDHRSRGIKDLRFGSLVEDAWGETPIDDLLTGLVPDGPWLADVTHHLVVGQLGSGVRHPLRTTFGDALVRSGSAAGAGRRRRIADGGEVVVVPVRASHTALTRHPDSAAIVGTVLAGEVPAVDGRSPAASAAASAVASAVAGDH